MVLEQIKKLTFRINTVILVMVAGLAAFFVFCKATFLIWFSIPTALVYVAGYFLIAKVKLDVYVRIVYSWLTLYMCVTTICLGNSIGFHLYCLSMIPIIFYTKYMAFQLGTKPISTTFFCVLVIVAFLLSTGYSAYVGPVYEVDVRVAEVFWIVNSLTVLGFVTFYSWLLIKMIIASEKILKDRADKDGLTHLFNRNYMMEQLKTAYADDKPYIIAMIDIDNFKMINDRYGHSAGDEVLRKVAALMEEICKDGVVSRWGGEEFLILIDDPSLIEKLHQAVNDLNVLYEGQKINVTMTAGVEHKSSDLTLDKWIVAADEKLYQGKNSGKNCVVM